MVDIAGRTGNFLTIADGSFFSGESDNNIFYGSSWGAEQGLFNGLTLSDWRSSTENDQNSSIADPLLLSTDYNDTAFCRPQADSPVIDGGEFTPNALDYNGSLRDSSRDIGACEYN